MNSRHAVLKHKACGISLLKGNLVEKHPSYRVLTPPCRLCGAVVRKNAKQLMVPCRWLAAAIRHGQVLEGKIFLTPPHHTKSLTSHITHLTTARTSLTSHIADISPHHSHHIYIPVEPHEAVPEVSKK